MENVARIVLGVEEHDVAEEVMHFLDRSGSARVVATAGDERQLVEAVRQLEPEAVIATPKLVRPESISGSPLLALDTRESISSLRAALRAGAGGYFLWPGEREELARAVLAVIDPAPATPGERAEIVAVYSPRGGSGATFLASHLAAALARRGRQCLLVDMDPLFGDLSAALGIAPESETDVDVDDVAEKEVKGRARTIADLLPVVDELSGTHIEDVVWRHPEGFGALLAPESRETGRVRAPDYAAIVSAAALKAGTMILHLPRALDEIARCGLERADRVLVVLTLDVFSFRDATRALAVFEDLGVRERCEFVVNRVSRSEIVPADVRRVFGKLPLTVVPDDRSVTRAQDRGRLLPRKGRAARSVDRLARSLIDAGA